MTKKNKAKLLPYLPQMKIGIRVLLGLVVLSVACLVGRCNSQSSPCPANTVQWEGTCAATPQAVQAAVPEIQPSSEKPSRHPEAAWERKEVIAAMPESQIANDTEQDNEKKCASIKGKVMAHIHLSEEEQEFHKSVCRQRDQAATQGKKAAGVP